MKKYANTTNWKKSNMEFYQYEVVEKRRIPITLGQKMYAHAMPKQFTMLKHAPYVIIPVFKSKEVTGGSFSALNPFSTIWCVIENIFLVATTEGLSCSMRIPLDEEHDIVKEKLKVPATYIIPIFIRIGYADSNEHELEQHNTQNLISNYILVGGDNWVIEVILYDKYKLQFRSVKIDENTFNI